MAVKRVLFLLLPVVLLVPLAAQEAPITEGGELLALEEGFLELFVAERYEEAFGLLRDHTAFSEEQLLELRDATASQLNSIRPQYGVPFGFELAREEELGERMVQRIYLVYQPFIPLRVRFVWYRNLESWGLINLNWDDSPTELLSW